MEPVEITSTFGIFEDGIFETDAEQVVQLDRGDFLLLYTDGIGEAENGSGEQFDHSAQARGKGRFELQRLFQDRVHDAESVGV